MLAALPEQLANETLKISRDLFIKNVASVSCVKITLASSGISGRAANRSQHHELLQFLR